MEPKGHGAQHDPECLSFQSAGIREVLTLSPSSLISSRSPSRHVMEDEMHEMTEGGWHAPNLKILKLTFQYVSPDFFRTLFYKFPLLKSLVVQGNLPMRNYCVDIRHPNLRSLTLYGCLPLEFSLSCHSLTHFSSVGQLDARVEGGEHFDPSYPPSLNRPNLRILHLSRRHCSIGLFEDIVSNARMSHSYITSLATYITDECPFTDLIHYPALRNLKVGDCSRGVVVTSCAWPLLESLRLDGTHFADDVEVAHVGLISLKICDTRGIMSPLLSSISLKHLELNSGRIDARCVQNLDQSCPQLKRVEIGILGFEEWWPGDDWADGPLEIRHERLKELVLRNISRCGNHVGCANLEKLVLKWDASRDRSAILRFPTLECPNLIRLELYDYAYLLRGMPGIRLGLPSLESLSCACDREDPEDLVLQHHNIRDIIFDTTQMSARLGGVKRLSCNMPSLVRVEVSESIQRMIKVEASDNVKVICTRYPGDDRYGD